MMVSTGEGVLGFLSGQLLIVFPTFGSHAKEFINMVVGCFRI